MESGTPELSRAERFSFFRCCLVCNFPTLATESKRCCKDVVAIFLSLFDQRDRQDSIFLLLGCNLHETLHDERSLTFKKAFFFFIFSRMEKSFSDHAKVRREKSEENFFHFNFITREKSRVAKIKFRDNDKSFVLRKMVTLRIYF